jgi:hypothetical protein
MEQSSLEMLIVALLVKISSSFVFIIVYKIYASLPRSKSRTHTICFTVTLAIIFLPTPVFESFHCLKFPEKSSASTFTDACNMSHPYHLVFTPNNICESYISRSFTLSIFLNFFCFRPLSLVKVFSSAPCSQTSPVIFPIQVREHLEDQDVDER